jgi:hypothetical protein
MHQRGPPGSPPRGVITIDVYLPQGELGRHPPVGQSVDAGLVELEKLDPVRRVVHPGAAGHPRPSSRAVPYRGVRVRFELPFGVHVLGQLDDPDMPFGSVGPARVGVVRGG